MAAVARAHMQNLVAMELLTMRALSWTKHDRKCPYTLEMYTRWQLIPSKREVCMA